MGLTFILFARFVFHDCDADMNNDSWEPVVTEPLTGTGEAGSHDGSLTFKLSEYFRKFPHKYLILFPNSMMIVWFIHGPCIQVRFSQVCICVIAPRHWAAWHLSPDPSTIFSNLQIQRKWLTPWHLQLGKNPPSHGSTLSQACLQCAWAIIERNWGARNDGLQS